MKWSFRVGTLAGIGIYIHATFFILLAFLGFRFYAADRSVPDALYGLAFVGAVFGTVVLHELGHALAARRYGIPTRDITLLPIGGVARLQRMPDDPKQELAVALAGPAVNVVLATMFGLVVAARGGFSPIEQAAPLGFDSRQFFEQMVYVNVTLTLFNLLPAFPMDGGRVLRALLAMRTEYTKATNIAATVGQGMAVLFGLFGLLVAQNPFLVFIALFVWIGAAQEAGTVQVRSALHGIPVSRAMVTEYHTLHPDDRLSRAAEYVLHGSRHDFPVEEGGRVVGVLTRDDLMAGLNEAGPDGSVGDAMHGEFQTADPRDTLTAAARRLNGDGCCKTMPVLYRGQLVGLVTPENLSDVLMIRQAVSDQQARRRLEI